MKKAFTAACAVIAALAAPLGASAAPVQWAGNGHWYEFVPTTVDWDDAFAAANAATFNGLQGYLATVTSADENRFVAGLAADAAGATLLAWLGGSDAGAEGNFTWRNGPESGQAFTFTSWSAGEPNNCCSGENYLHINWGQFGDWNDHGGPGNPGQLNGYVIEYTDAIVAVPEPASLALVASALAALALRRRRPR